MFFMLEPNLGTAPRSYWCCLRSYNIVLYKDESYHIMCMSDFQPGLGSSRDPLDDDPGLPNSCFTAHATPIPICCASAIHPPLATSQINIQAKGRGVYGLMGSCIIPNVCGTKLNGIDV